jgi:Glycosyl transferase family 11
MVTTTLQGRCGNNFYQIAMLLAYAKKHNLEYYIPDVAYHCDGRKMYFPHLAMGPELQGLQEYHEQPVHAVPKGDGTFLYNVPAYTDIPQMNNMKFVGYWQSFKYFDDYRDYILEKFQWPTEETGSIRHSGTIGIHCRFGDFTQLRDKHPELPNEYYIAAVRHFITQGYTTFQIFSDDISAARKYFADVDWGTPITIWAHETYRTELEDLTDLSFCAHQILCYSTFGFIAAWLNRNPDKQVIIPPSRYIFGGANADFIPDTFLQLDF